MATRKTTTKSQKSSRRPKPMSPKAGLTKNRYGKGGCLYCKGGTLKK